MFEYEEDWKLFRKRLPIWQNAYLKRLNAEYIEILSGIGSEEEKFWTLEQRIREDRKSAGIYVRMARSQLLLNLVRLVRAQVISIEDLEGFSADLVQMIKRLTRDDV